MFEQALAFVLKRILGEFVEDGDVWNDKIQWGVWSGLIVLEDMVLKNSLLALVDIPVTLAHGSIGRLELRIPWARLGIEPVIIIVDRINLILEPKYEWNPGATERREQAVKQAKLAAAELFAHNHHDRLKGGKRQLSYSDYAKQWLMSSVVNKIVDNVQVTVREVHVRFEDQVSCPTNFCVGLTFESLHIQSRDPSIACADAADEVPEGFTGTIRTPTIDTNGFATFFKQMQLDQLSFYWNPLVETGLNVCTCRFIGRPRKEIQSFMKRTIPTRSHLSNMDRPRHHYLLLPIDITTYLDVSVNALDGKSKVRSKIRIKELALRIEDRQIREIISVAMNMANFAKLERFSEYRPTGSVAENPRAWWRYCIHAVLSQIRIDRKKQLSLRRFSARIKDKMVYIQLWKMKLVTSAAVLSQLNFLDFREVEEEEKKNMKIDNSTEWKYDKRRRFWRPTLDRGSGDYVRYLSRARRIAAHRKAVNESKGYTDTKTGKKKIDGISSLNQEDRNIDSLNAVSMRLLRTLEYHLSFEDIVLFRSLAEQDFSPDEIETYRRNKGGWLGGVYDWFGGFAAGEQPDSATESLASEGFELFQALKFDPDRILAGGVSSVNQSEVMAAISLQIEEGSVTLALTSPEVSTSFQAAIPFLQVKLEDFHVRPVVMGNGKHIQVALWLQDISVSEIRPNAGPRGADSCNEFLYRRELVHIPTDMNEIDDSVDSQKTSRLDMATVPFHLKTNGLSTKRMKRGQRLPPLIYTNIEKFPPGTDTDVVVNLKVEEIEVRLSPAMKWTEAMATFVSWPEDLQYWSEMEMSALNELADFKSQVDAKIEYMMQNHSNIIIQAEINAPVVVIADSRSLSDTGDVLVVDFGYIVLKTEKLAKAQRQKALEEMQSNDKPSDLTPVRSSAPFTFGGELTETSISKENLSSQGRVHHGNHSDHLDMISNSQKSGEWASESDTSSVLGVGNEKSFLSAPLHPLRMSNGVPDDGSINTIGERFEGNQPEQALFDIFQCKITNSEVYITRVGQRKSEGSSFRNQSKFSSSSSAVDEVKKTIILERFEVGVEIHVSVLPWDTTIPPAKLFTILQEVNIHLSESKLRRLNQFAMHLVNQSNAVRRINSAQWDRLTKVIKQKQKSAADTRAVAASMSIDKNDSHDSVQFSSVQPVFKQRTQQRSMDLMELSARSESNEVSNEVIFFDAPIFDSGLNQINGVGDSTKIEEISILMEPNFSGGSCKSGNSESSFYSAQGGTERSRAGIGFEGDASDDDDSSFFSVEEDINENAVKEQREQLLYIIAQRESMQAKYLSDIRTTESDPTKINLHETLKKQLLECEFELQQLRVNYLELTMRTDSQFANDFHELKRKSMHTDEAKVSRLIFPDDQPQSSSTDRSGSPRLRGSTGGHKLNLTQASTFRIPGRQLKFRPLQILKSSGNKELVFMKLNVLSINITLECDVDEDMCTSIFGTAITTRDERRSSYRSSSRKKRSLPPRSSPEQASTPAISVHKLVCGLKLSGISLKIRHRLHDTRAGLSVQSLDIEDLVKYKDTNSAIHRSTSQPIFLMSSDSSLFGFNASSLPSYSGSSGNELLRIKYEAVYGQDTAVGSGRKDFPDLTIHNLKVAMGFIGINVEQHRLNVLIQTMQRILSLADKPIQVSPSSPEAYPPSNQFEKSCHAEIGEKRLSAIRLPNIVFAVKIDHFTVRLVKQDDSLFRIGVAGDDNARPVPYGPKVMMSFDIWSFNTVGTSQSHEKRFSITARLAETALYGYFGAFPGVFSKASKNLKSSWASVGNALASDRFLIFGREQSNMQPFFTVSCSFSIPEEYAANPAFTGEVTSVPLKINVNLDFITNVLIELSRFIEIITSTVQSVQQQQKERITISAPTEIQERNVDHFNIFLNTLLTQSIGGIKFSIGGISVYFQSLTSGEKGMKVLNKNYLSIGWKSVHGVVQWGELQLGRVVLKADLAIDGVAVTVAHYYIVDPFDIFISNTLQPTNPIESSGAPFKLPQHDVFQGSDFSPKDLDSSSEVQISISVTPIAMHINESILQALCEQAALLLPVYLRFKQEVEKSLSDPNIRSNEWTLFAHVPTAYELKRFEATPIANKISTLLGVNMKCEAILHEFSIALESASKEQLKLLDGFLSPKFKFVVSRASVCILTATQSMEESSDTRSANEELIDNGDAVFMIEDNEEDDVENMDRKQHGGVDSKNNLNDDNVLEVRFIVGAVDFEFIRGREVNGYRRLLTTGLSVCCDNGSDFDGNDGTAEISSIRSRDQSLLTSGSMNNFSVNTAYSHEAWITLETSPHFIDSFVLFSDDGGVDIGFAMKNFHLTIISDALVEMLKLMTKYASAIVEVDVATLEGNTGSTSDTANSFTVKSSGLAAHPSSVPMTANTLTLASNDGAQKQLRENVNNPVLCSWTAFSIITTGVHSVRMKWLLRDCFLHVPSSRRGGPEPVYTIGCPVSGLLSLDDISGDNLLGYFEPKNNDLSQHSHDILHLEVNLDGINAVLDQLIPQEVSEPVTRLSLDDRLHNKWKQKDPERFSSSAKQNKMLLFPLHGRAQYTLTMSAPICEAQCSQVNFERDQIRMRVVSGGQLGISHYVQVNIEKVEAQLLMDIKPLLDLYEASIVPIIEEVKSSQKVLASITSAVADRESNYGLKSNASKSFPTNERNSFVKEYNKKLYFRKDAQDMDKKFAPLQVRKFPAIFSFVNMGHIRAQVQISTVHVYVVNDVFSQSSTIARLSITNIDAEASRTSCPANYYFLTSRNTATSNISWPSSRSSAKIVTPLSNVANIQTDQLNGEGRDHATGNEEIKSTVFLPEPMCNNSSKIISAYDAFAKAVKEQFEDFSSARNAGNRIEAGNPSGEGRSKDDVLTVDCRLVLSVDYYNQKLIATEPLVEPFPLKIGCVVPVFPQYVPRKMILMASAVDDNRNQLLAHDKLLAECCFCIMQQVVSAAITEADIMRYFNSFSSSTNESIGIRQPALFESNQTQDSGMAMSAVEPVTVKIAVDFPDAININITMPLLEIFFICMQAFDVTVRRSYSTSTFSTYAESKSFRDKSKISGAERSSDISFVRIRNDSGMPLVFWTNDERASVDVQPCCEVPMPVPSQQRNEGEAANTRSRSRYSPSRHVNFMINGTGSDVIESTTFYDIPLEGVGTRLFSLQQRIRAPEGLIPSDETNTKIYDTLHNPNAAERDANQTCSDEMGEPIRKPILNSSSRGSLAVSSCTADSLSEDISSESSLNHKENTTPQDSTTKVKQFGFTEKHSVSNIELRPSSAMPTVALELTAYAGAKTLVVRSTLRLYNSMKISMRVQLVKAKKMRDESTSPPVLWEIFVPPHTGVPLPASLCDVTNGRFIVKAVLTAPPRFMEGSYWPRPDRVPDSSVAGCEIPMPMLPGWGEHISHQDGDSSYEAFVGASPIQKRKMINEIQWRKKISQRRGAPDTVNYQHWLQMGEIVAPTPISSVQEFIKTGANSLQCNVNITSKGMQYGHGPSTEGCMLRTINFSPPVSVVNLMAGRIAVAITPDVTAYHMDNAANSSKAVNSSQLNDLNSLLATNQHLDIPKSSLLPGETWEYYAAYPCTPLSLSIKMAHDQTGGDGVEDNTFDQAYCHAEDKWSSPVLIPGCQERANSLQTFTLSVPFKNGSILCVQAEVIDRDGERIITLFVPFWILSYSFMPLEFQHDPRLLTGNTKGCTENGRDGLAADQMYRPQRQKKSVSKANSAGKLCASQTEEMARCHGLGRARGIDGIVLGPEVALRGAMNAFTVCNSRGLLSQLNDYDDINDKRTVRLEKPDGYDNAGLLPLMKRRHGEVIKKTEKDIVASGPLKLQLHNESALHRAISKTSDAEDSTFRYRLIQCGYSKLDNRVGTQLKVRVTKNSPWSRPFAVDKDDGIQLDAVSRSTGKDFDGDMRLSAYQHKAMAQSPASIRSGDKLFTFGVMRVPADPPFNRTQLVLVVDRIVLVNHIGLAIEIKQVNCEDIFALKADGEELPLWWRSGPQLLQLRLARYGWNWSGKFAVDKEGEISLRLRNQFDNTVYYVMVQVVFKGSRVFIAFKGGEKFSPFRFENHSVNTFRIRQKDQTEKTNLLPYHCCGYAWDEPLQEHQVTIEVLKNPHQPKEDWKELGTYSFNRLGPVRQKNKEFDHLSIKIITQGPTRVLQLFDQRLSNQMFDQQGTESTTRLNCPLIHLTANLKSLGLSFVDHYPQELIYFSLGGLHTDIKVFDQQLHSAIRLKRLQVDNQLWSTPFPTLLHPQFHMKFVSSQNGGEEEQEEILGFNETTDEDFAVINVIKDFRYAGVDYFPLMTMKVVPFNINVDGSIIARCIETASVAANIFETTANQYLFPYHRKQSHHYVFEQHAKDGQASVLNDALEGAAELSRMNTTYFDSKDAISFSPYNVISKNFKTTEKKMRPAQIDYVQGLVMALSSFDRRRAGQVTTTSDSQSSRYDHHRHHHPENLMSTLFLPHDPNHDASLQMKFIPSEKTRHSSLVTASVTSGVHHSDDQTGAGTGKEEDQERRIRKSLLFYSDQRSSLVSHVVQRALDSTSTPMVTAKPSSKVYMEDFNVSKLRMKISFNPIVSVESIKPKNYISDEDASLLNSAVRTVLLAIGSTFAKIDQCPIYFESYKLDNAFLNGNVLVKKIVTNYTIQALKQLYLVVLSSEVLGNPVRLLQTVGDGVGEFVNSSASGLRISPRAFVWGVLSGTASLCCTITAGLCATAGSLASSLQVGMLNLGVVDDALPTLLLMPPDDPSTSNVTTSSEMVSTTNTNNELTRVNEQRQRAAMQVRDHTRPRLENLWQGFRMGIVGVVYDPIRGFQIDGIRGLVVGASKGAMGLVARPLFSALGISAGLLNGMAVRLDSRFLQSGAMKYRRARAPRFFSRADSPLRIYSADENVGQELLYRLNNGEFRHEGYLWHTLLLRRNHTVILTKMRILIVEETFNKIKLLWNSPFSKIVSLEVEYTRQLTRQSRHSSSSINVANDVHAIGEQLAYDKSEIVSSFNYVASDLSQFKSCLKGTPSLHLYHIPSSAFHDPVSKGSTGTMYLSASPNRMTTSGIKSPGVRLSQNVVTFNSHEDLLRFLNCILRRHHSLASDDVLQYISDAGVDIAGSVRKMELKS